MRHALFVILGAGLWATDTLFRHPLSKELSPVTIVYYEHLFAVLISLAWVLISDRKAIFPGWKEFAGAAFIGVCGSAWATVLFTLSFRYLNPTVAILVQKIQPVIVIGISALFLGEKPGRGFLLWGALAMVSAFFVSFPEGVEWRLLRSASTFGTLLAVLAAGLWALSTVAGKIVLKRTPVSVLSFWRFAFGLLALHVLTLKFDQVRIEMPFVLHEPRVLYSLFFMAVIPGFLGVMLYYKGLSRVQAARATLLELSFPLAALWINSTFLGLHLKQTQLFAAGALLVSMVGVSLDQIKARSQN
jgi:drug/metabolite transporter (DMT)-like permease